MADRSISISLEARVQGFVSGLRTAQQASKDFASRTAAFAREHEASMDRIGKAGMIMGGGMLAGVGMAVKSFADFDAAMSEVRASTRETAGNMDLLRQAAIDAGADTAFSASEAAKGIDELAKAGVSTKDILGGGLKGALSLAAAGSLGVGESAEIAASAMTQFKLSGEDIPHIADLLAAGAGKAQGSVQDMGAALNQAGLVAGQTGLTIEETTGGLAAFASAGLTGSDAGTSFKTMLAALTPNSEASAKAMEELGLSAYDSQGNFIGLSEFAGKLQGSLSGLTDEQRNSTMETIFGSDAVRAASVLYEQGAAGVEKWEAAVNDAGFAAETAAIKQDNLAGDFEKLTGSLDSVFLKSGSGANEVLRGLVQSTEDFVDAIGDIPTPVLNAAVGLAAVLGGAALLGGGLITVIPRIVETRDALAELAPAGGRARGALAAVAKAAGILAAAAAGFEAVKGLHNSMQPAARSLEEFTQALVGLDKNSGAIDSIFADIGAKEFEGDIRNAGAALNRLINQDFHSAIESFGASNLGIDNGMAKLADAVTKTDQALSGAVSSGNMEMAADGFKSIAESSEGQALGLEKVAERFPEYIDSLRALANEAGVSLTQQDLLNWAMGDTPAAMEAAAAAAKPATETIKDVGTAAEQAAKQAADLVESLLNINNANLSASDAQLGFDQAIADAAKNFDKAGAGVDYLNEKTGEFNQTAADNLKMLNGIAAQGSQVAQTVYDQSGSYDQFKTSLEGSRQSLFDVAKAYFPTTEAAWAYVNSVMAIPPKMLTEVNITDNNTIQGVNQNLLLLHDSIQKTPDKTVIIKEPMSPEIRKGLEGLGYIVKTLPDGTIQVTETGTDATGKKIDGTARKQRIATITAAAQTGAAEADLNYAARPRLSQVTQTILQKFQADPSAPPVGTGTVLAPKRKATGGPIFGPGTGTSDDIPAMLSNGEHVLTAEEVVRMGGHAAVGRMRALAKAGLLPRFASGGEVGHLGESANARANRLHREAQARAKARAAAEKKRRDELRRTAQYRIDQMNDLRLDYARGESYRTVDDSLSSAYSFSDRLRSVAASGNVPRSAGALNQRANWSDQQMRSLHAQSEKLTKSLETAKSRLQDLTQVRNGIRDNLAGGFSIGDAVKRGNMYGSAKMSDIQGSAAGYLSRVQAFAGKLKRLQQMGYSGAIVQEIAEMGLVEGAKAADVLMTGTKADVKSLNKTKTAIDQASTSAGNAVTDALSKGGIQAADAFVKRLEQQQGAISKTMLSVGLAMENALRVALGSKAIKRAGGGPVHGPGSGTSDDVPALLSNGEHVFTAEEVRRMGGHAAVQRFRQGLAGGYRYAPAAAPRLHIPAPQAQGGRAGQTFGDVHITQQSDPVATFQEFSRRTRRLST